MPSFFSPSPSHGAVISSVAFAIRSFTSVSYNTFVPFWGTVLAQHGQARYPTWASTLPHLGTFAARMLPICPQYGRLRLGFLKKTEFHLSSCCFRRTKSICPSPYDNPSYPSQREGTSYSATDYSQSYQPSPSLQTHPTLPKGKE